MDFTEEESKSREPVKMSATVWKERWRPLGFMLEQGGEFKVKKPPNTNSFYSNVPVNKFWLGPCDRSIYNGLGP